MPDVERPPTGLGISHVGLSVRDLERSLAFYCDVLGARVLRPPYDSVRGRFRMAVIAWGPISFDLCRHDDGEGERFDPQLHEAVAQLPVEGAESGTVVEVYQRGYRLGEVVIRPARVVVAA